MSKVFDGKVSILPKGDDEMELVKDEEGNFSAENAAELYAKMQEIAKKKKLKIHKWSLMETKGGTEPVLLANRWGKPYLAILPKRPDGKTGRKKLEKLA